MLPTSARVAQEVYERSLAVPNAVQPARRHVADRRSLHTGGSTGSHWCHASESAEAKQDPQNNPTVLSINIWKTSSSVRGQAVTLS